MLKRCHSLKKNSVKCKNVSTAWKSAWAGNWRFNCKFRHFGNCGGGRTLDRLNWQQIYFLHWIPRQLNWIFLEYFSTLPISKPKNGNKYTFALNTMAKIQIHAKQQMMRWCGLDGLSWSNWVFAEVHVLRIESIVENPTNTISRGWNWIKIG